MNAFTQRAERALADPTLKLAIDRTTSTARTKRAAAMAAWPAFPEARELGRDIKDHVIAHLDHYLAEFERNAIASGAKLHWASTAQEACDITIGICRDAGARSVTRAKSMLGEEIGLPHALAEAGIERIETDLAEHIIQLAGDPPSHIVWPALHKTREQVRELFQAGHADPGAMETVSAMVWGARRELRAKFMAADVGISGANFLVADTGAVCTVTNEGNAELTTTPPPRAHRHRRHRKAGALHRPCDDHAAPAGALGDRRGTDAVHNVPLRPEAGRRCGRPRRIPHRAGR